RARAGAATVNGEEGIVAMVMMITGENSRQTAQLVAAKLDAAQKHLPPGVVIRPLHTRAELVGKTIGTVEKNLLEGALLVTAVLFFTLGNWRAALIVAAAIPLAFLFALAGMSYLGVSGNLMSLGAIDFGLVIDGAVVLVENVVRQLGGQQHKLGRKLTCHERVQIVLSASRQAGTPVFFGVLIITLVYLPVLALTGIEGKMFHPMAVAVMLALGGALVLTLTVAPALCAVLLRGTVREGDNWLFRRLTTGYERALRLAVQWRWIVATCALALLGLSGFAFTRLGQEFIPTLDEGALVIQFNRDPAISLEASIAEQCRAEKLLRDKFPEITSVFTTLGTPEIATDPMGVNQADTWVLLKPRPEWRPINGKHPAKPELIKAMRELLEQEFKGTELLFSQPIEMRFNELLEGIRADISVKIYGDNYDVTEQVAAEIKTALEKIPGTGEIEFETLGRVPLLEITARRDALSWQNVHSAEINHVIEASLAGQNVGILPDGNRRLDLMVRLPDSARENLSLLRELPVRVGEHGVLPLGALAKFEMTKTVSPILREAGHRRAALLVNLDSSDMEGWVRRAKVAVRDQVGIPDGVTVEFGGQFQNLVEARARLAVVVPAALLLIFALIFMAFGSGKQALLVFTGIPLAATGGVFALLLRGMPFSITAAIGFIALSGVAVLNGVVMISYTNELRLGGKRVKEAIMEGALTRLRPVITTALVASLGFIPMAIATGPGAEVQRPLATVVIGGILTSTFLTLILLPVLYGWFERDEPSRIQVPDGFP
ncbi:MAG TPA: CusA/CzcA family heavy metal efflux RND transporter, partial [Verrucomicrobiae bacterium]|nr:CusA/CzcA family heavy metal efflux RND transporter [Verrucomicrobiae bacterium]